MHEEELKKDLEEIHNHNFEEEPENNWKGPLKWIAGIFLVLIVITWIVPHYGIKLDPSPGSIPSYDEVVPDFEAGNVTKVSAYSDINKIMMPNDETVKGVADRIVSASCNGERVCNAKAIFRFVKENMEYVNDPLAYEYIKSPKETLKVRVGDCDDGSTLLANLLQAVGIRTRFVFVPEHVFVQAYMPEALSRYKREEWVSMDVTCESCGFGEESYIYSKSERQYLEV